MGNKKVVPINRKNKKNKIKSLAQVSAKRVFIFVIIVILIFIALAGRIGYLQFVKGEYLKQKEYSQSTSSTVISAKRGTIYDSNKKALAISADVDTITVNPSYLVVKTKGEINEEKTKQKIEKLTEEFVKIFELDYDEVYEKLNSKRDIETIVSKVENDKVEELKKWLVDNKISAGINIDKDTKRYYPYHNLASNLIGFCGADNQGLDGVELKYEDILKGTNGKITTSISVTQDAIPDDNEKYIAPENGSNIYLTIDSNIQAIAEKYLKQAVEENDCKRGGNVIIENPSNGEILAMASYPDYDLNEPYTPNETLSEGWDSLSTQEQSDKLYAMWRNKAVVDTYEPGSTFKVITASTALEENITETDIAGDFYCSGVQKVAEAQIKCAAGAVHGSETLRKA